jgi:hypothetical protein
LTTSAQIEEFPGDYRDSFPDIDKNQRDVGVSGSSADDNAAFPKERKFILK